MKILIAEDDETSRNLLARLLQKNGHEVIATRSGEEAWSFLQNPDAPRLLVLDWVMPDLDGAGLCQRIRATQADIQPYIIMLTIKNKLSDIIWGLGIGADDYLCKPFDAGELQARIEVGQRILHLQEALAARINEKELLLHEVHHRMKNNMATIGALLELQAAAMPEPQAASALLDARGRLVSMGILYDKLYRSENVLAMSLKNYLPGLIEEIASPFPHREQVTIQVEIEDIVLSAKILTTLGIIVNELVCNIMKHAFVGHNSGLASVSAYSQAGRVVLQISDNGIGIPENMDYLASPGFGLQLTQILTEQIGGTIELKRGNGTCTTIEFTAS